MSKRYRSVRQRHNQSVIADRAFSLDKAYFDRIDGRRLRRNGAGDRSWAVTSGRNKTNKVLPCCKARCNRRVVSARICCCRNRTAPMASLRRSCSTAQKVLAVRSARIHISFDGSIPSPANARHSGTCGGVTCSMLCLATFISAGTPKRSSPIPGCGKSKSIDMPIGQPPLGSSTHKVKCPVSTTRLSVRPSWDARHWEGCIASSAAFESPCINLSRNAVFLYSIHICSGFGKVGLLPGDGP